MHSNASSHTHHRAESVPALVAVFCALILLTLLNVGLRQLDWGSYNFAISISISSVKATLVGYFFMHLAGERSFIWVVIGVTLLAAIFFMLMSGLDSVRSSNEINRFIHDKPDRILPNNQSQ